MLTKYEREVKYVKTIQSAALDRYNTYFSNDTCYRGLKNRCQVIDNAIDLRFPQNEAFISEIAPPVVRKDYYETNAFLVKYFENDPLVRLDSCGGTPQSNAENAQAVLMGNFTNTRFREECLMWAFDNMARYGTAVVFSQFNPTYRGTGLQTSYSKGGASPYPRIPTVGRKAVVNYSIHPLNYFQDPMGNSIGQSFYCGFIDQWYVSDLFKYQGDPHYIQNNLAEVIRECKKGQTDQFWYAGGLAEVKDHTRATINPIRMFMLLNFDGNEQDTTVYYCEIVNNTLIRCEPNDTDYGIIPLNTGVYFPRPDVWWGNCSVDMKIPFQNIKNWIINASVEGTMKQMDRMVLVRRGGGLNVADINNRHQFGGVVFYDGMEDPQRLIHPVQFQNTAGTDLDWLNREINQMVQESSPVVNLQNRYNEGGLNNGTLGAAQMIAGIGEVMFNFTMRHVGYFIERISETNLNLLIQNLSDSIPVKRSPTQNEEQLAKQNVLGEFLYKSYSSMLVNEKSDRVDKSNMINQVLNWKGTGNPAFQGINEKELVKQWLRSWIGSNADMSLFYDQNFQSQPPAPKDKIAVSINFKDLPPTGQIQAAAQAGIKLAPTDVIQGPLGVPAGSSPVPGAVVPGGGQV